MQEAPATTSKLGAEVCAGADCSKPAGSLACPTCLKLGITTSKFCDQECFKRNWATHKELHVKPKETVDGVEVYDPFPSSAYTGTLRACYQKNRVYNPRDASQRRAVPAGIVKPNYADDPRGDPKYSFLERRGNAKPKELESWEQEGMRRVCRLSREVLDHAASFIRPGITTTELDAIVHQACIDRGAYPSPLNYRNFPKSVCTSVNEVICHGIPDFRPLQEGDIVNLDVSLYYGGFHGDLNATYPVGKIDKDSERLIRTARECLDAAIAMAKPGVLFRDFGAVIEAKAKENGCTVNKTYCGHGINQLFHPAPNIPHYAGNRAPHYLKPGQTFTIEPMICLGAGEETHWPDDWTAVTRDGKRSAQFEETLLVTETGVEVLTAAPTKKSKKKKETATTNTNGATETNGVKEANGDKEAVEEVTEKVAETKLEA